MARRRMIDPDFWENEDIAKLTVFERLFYIGLFSNADDFGKGKAHTSLLRSKIFPYDDIKITDIQKAMEHIQENTKCFFYEVNGEKFYKILNWDKYQRVDKPCQSNIPDPPKNNNSNNTNMNNSGMILGNFTNNSMSNSMNDSESHSENDSENDSKNDSKNDSENDSRLREKKRREDNINKEKRNNVGDFGASAPPVSADAPTPPVSKKSQKEFSQDSEAFMIADYLFKSILSWDPDHKKPNLQVWARDADLLLNRDKRNFEFCMKIINSLPCAPRSPSNFCWRDVILSVSKFREKFDQIKFLGNGFRTDSSSITKSDKPQSIEAYCPRCKAMRSHELFYENYICFECNNKTPADKVKIIQPERVAL